MAWMNYQCHDLVPQGGLPSCGTGVLPSLCAGKASCKHFSPQWSRASGLNGRKTAGLALPGTSVFHGSGCTILIEPADVGVYIGRVGVLVQELE
jgi:hypothetical protein